MSRFERLLRFLNVLEPSPDMVLSKTKLAFWIALGLVVYAIGWLTDAMVITSVIGLFSAAAGLDGYRRYMQYSNGQNPYAEHGTPAMKPTDPPGSQEEPNASD